MTQTIIVTGGARGIGAAIVKLAAARGARVLFSFVSAEAQARALEGERVRALRADAADPGSPERLIAACTQAFGPPDGLVNAAGITGPVKRVTEQTADDIARTLAVNVTGLLLMCGAFGRMHAAAPKPGRAIVNIGSIAGRTGGMPGAVVYAATKGAVSSLTIGLMKELTPAGIRVNAITPGLIGTDMLEAISGGADKMAALGRTTPIGRVAEPEEVAEAALWLLGPGASYVSGSILEVAGGRAY